LAIDNGYIFEWGLNLNPALYPGITTFTPSIGSASDSSYWEIDPDMLLVDGNTNSDIMQVIPPAAGTYDFTYHVINSFGCEYDTTVQITFVDPLQVSAPADQTYSCGDLVLQGWFQGLPTPACADCGVFNHCYSDGENFTWTFCPDNPGDGTTLSFEFLSGQMEGFFENFTVYDGNSTAAPIIATWSTGDATGQSWSATNSGGCITVSFSADGSVSCGGGFYTPWQYSVSPGGPAYTWEWSPTAPVNFFNDPTLQAPTISNLTQTTTFTVTGYPVGHPGCASSDDVTVFIDPLGDPGLDADITVCNNDPAFDLFSQLGGTPVTTGTWTDPNGVALAANPQYDPATSTPGDYTYTVSMGACNAFATVTVGMNLPYQMTVANDTSICYMGQLNMDLLTQQDGNTPFNYSWDYNGVVISNAMDYTGYHPTQSGTACLTVTDFCNDVITDCFNVEVKTLVPVTMNAEPPAACWPENMSVEITTDPTLYTQSTLTFSDGFTVSNIDSVSRNFANPGVYNVSLTLIDDIGCVYDTTIFGYLTSYNPPVAGWLADPQPADAENTTIQFTDMSEGSVIQYYWEFDTLTHAGTSEEQNPSFTFPPGIGGDYIVSQVVVDQNGCMDYAFGNIHVNELFQFFVPNCFTPNGDNINDAISFVGTDIDPTYFELTIFNRWGDIVFHTKDPNDHWQGDTYNGDYFVPNGVYMWNATLRSISTGEKKEIQGNITIAR
jgi:gliding motility-associated-like protein